MEERNNKQESQRVRDKQKKKQEYQRAGDKQKEKQEYQRAGDKQKNKQSVKSENRYDHSQISRQISKKTEDKQDRKAENRYNHSQISRQISKKNEDKQDRKAENRYNHSQISRQISKKNEDKQDRKAENRLDNRKSNMSETRQQASKKNNREKTSTSICPISKKCGGCQYLDMEYKLQLEKKKKYLSNLLEKFGKVAAVNGMDNPYHYRNKVTATFKHKRDGEIISGVYEEGTHKVLPVTSCYIEDEKADDIIQTIKGVLKSFKITVYNEDSGYGLLRHVLIRTAHATGEVMVVLVTADPIFPSKKNFAKALVAKHPEVKTIVQNINSKSTSMVLGERNQIIYGKGYIEDVLCGKRFRISPGSFYQVNPIQTEKLYAKAMEYAGLNSEKTDKVVIDAYCGIGTIGMVAADKAKHVIGVELNKAAVADAKVNASINKVSNISFYANDAGKFMVDMANQGKKADIVFMDPPRSGSTETFMQSVITLLPEKIVYISCGPESLARDLKYFVKSGKYRVEKMEAYDLFPMTEHVETVVLLRREKVDGYVSVDIDVEKIVGEGRQRICNV